MKGNQRVLLKIVVWFLVADLIVLLFQIIVRIYSEISFFGQADLTPIVIIAGVLAAIITLVINQLHKASEEYLKHATSLLSKAYETFVSSRDKDGRPLMTV